MNYLDFLIIILFILYVLAEYRRGFLRLMAELLGIALAFLFALKFFRILSDFLVTIFPQSDSYIKPLAFLIIWFAVQLIFVLISNLISVRTPLKIRRSLTNTILGIIPAGAKAVLLLAMLLLLMVSFPGKQELSQSVNDSFIGSYLVKQTLYWERVFKATFSPVNDPRIGSGFSDNDRIVLNFKTTKISPDEMAEAKMLQLINEEREKIGLSPLKADTLLRNVARAHASDMLIQGYFSHTSFDGRNFKDRLENANVIYSSAGENLAIAPTIELAHKGLMDSPKHKENILDPHFIRVGIGVMDAGVYGLMVTQAYIY